MRNLFSGADALVDATGLLDETAEVQSLVAVFMLALAGDEKALTQLRESSTEAAGFFRDCLETIEGEIDEASNVPAFGKSLEALAENSGDLNLLRKVFFPEGTGLPGTRNERVTELRHRRKIRITELNPDPLSDPGRELLFTSNVLLTVPAASISIDELEYSDELKEQIKQAAAEEQIYWFDHPIQIGVKPESNEILYGLRGLDEAIEFERARGNMPGEKAACVLSVSVTHNGLHGVARQYIETEIRKAGGFRNLDVFVFTEADTRQLIEKVLVPAAQKFQGLEQSFQGLEVFGVDGEYGRHYSFLKAIAALWHAAKDSDVKATFKIDLDQVFPQTELVEQSGASAFEHFKTPLWGARGTAADGSETELGMIAGALVNEKDIHQGLFTPDVPFPENGPATLEEKFFYSKMLMALSTEGELMTRYRESGIDGKTECIQRIHVTGGTNGILVDSLLRHRPFTPSFIGRAEDQCYILSVLMEAGEKLAYVHEDGLIMRHDKEAFAGDAIKAASFGNMIGDYIRTIYFSGYARVLNEGDIGPIKDIVNPFTGCFISRIPVTIVMMRFCMKAIGFFLAGEAGKGSDFLLSSYPRLARAMKFAKNELQSQYQLERNGWNLFYDTLGKLSAESCEKASRIVDDCRILG
ncbi:MAG: hypothetical protein K9M45_07635 [Kiritimatiellales bacterium]|nr:hypothetical protein [Kiritimatiellales bacterium]